MVVSRHFEFERMADLCIEAGNAVMQSGSEELKCAARMMLLTLAHDIARHEKTLRVESGVVIALPRRARRA